MTTWANLLDGYNIAAAIVENNNYILADVVTSDFYNYILIDFLRALPTILEFVFYSFLSAFFLITIFIGFWKIIITGVFGAFTVFHRSA